MSSAAVEACIRELEDVHERLSAFLDSLRLARQHTTLDETKEWLSGPMGAHQTQLALMESVLSGLKTLQGTSYPDVPVTLMPAEVSADVQAVYQQLSDAAERVKASMGLLHHATQTTQTPPVVEPPAQEHQPAPEPESESESSESEEYGTSPRRRTRN